MLRLNAPLDLRCSTVEIAVIDHLLTPCQQIEVPVMDLWNCWGGLACLKPKQRLLRRVLGRKQG